jgi:hypothetical protein
MASTYTPIATTTLGSAATSYTFTSIPTTYTDLILIVNAKNASTGSYPKMQVGNGSVDTGNNYSRTYLTGNAQALHRTETPIILLLQWLQMQIREIVLHIPLSLTLGNLN